jgi:broad specificity phosphatase PhoE
VAADAREGRVRARADQPAPACAAHLLGELADVACDVLLVSHGHFLRVLTATYVGEPPSFGGRLQIGAGTLSTLGREHGVPAIASWNLNPPPR